MNEKEQSIGADKKLAAVCGLFCPACQVYIGTNEDPARLAAMAQRLQRPLEDLKCSGCRSEKRCFYCESKCTMTRCASANGVDFCGACPEYPCKDLKAFQAELPHRIELWKSQDRIREVGYERWFAEMTGHYSCPKCKTINSAYDVKCRRCGHEPSCGYVAAHKQAIEQFLASRR
jgi:hypothetical protein